MFRRYSTGNASLMDLADDLSSRGFRPRSKRGHVTFGQKTIRGMLSNPFYVGDITYHGEVVGPGQHEPIIERDLFEAVQIVRAARARRPQTIANRTSRPYLLRGIARCADCGEQMWANTMRNGRHNYYRCAARLRGRSCSARASGVPADAPDAYVSKLFATWEQPSHWTELIATPPAVLNGPDGADATQNELRCRLQRVRRALIDGVLPYELATEEIRKTETALAKLQETESPPWIDEPNELTDVRDLWPEMTPAERHDLVTAVLEMVVIDSGSGTVKGMLPRPEFVPIFRGAAHEQQSLSVVTWRPRADSNRRSPP